MKHAKHTPGPWATISRVEGNHVGPDAKRAKEFDICITPQTEEGRANARLIASAPCLLEALEQLLDAVGILRQSGVNVLAVPQAVKARELAHAAIKKARGES